MKILIVEEEVRDAGYIQNILAERSLSAERTRTQGLGDAFTLDDSYDLVIIDVDSPQRNGSAVCRTIRQQSRDTAVMIVSTLGSAADKVLGLDSGADDYLAKPFHNDELFARVQALTRRRRLAGQLLPTRKVADVEIDSYKRTVVRNGKRIALTATEFALLELLMRNKNQVLPRQYISEAVWGIGFDRRTNLVDVYINYLRHKIDAGSDERLILTVVGKGYMLREAPLS